MNNMEPTYNFLRDCAVLKQEYITVLGVSENQIDFQCKLNEDKSKYIINVSAISTPMNPLPEDIEEQIDEGIKLPKLGINVKSSGSIKRKEVRRRDTPSNNTATMVNNNMVTLLLFALVIVFALIIAFK